jgi:hypothetical protein
LLIFCMYPLFFSNNYFYPHRAIDFLIHAMYQLILKDSTYIGHFWLKHYNMHRLFLTEALQYVLLMHSVVSFF